MANIGYVRVSTTDQKTDRQLEGVALDKVFEDKASAADTARPQLLLCLDYVRQGDTLHVHSIDPPCPQPARPSASSGAAHS